MTKKQLKSKYNEWNQNIGKLSEYKQQIYKELQDLNVEKGDGKRWHSLDLLVEGLSINGLAYHATKLLSEYYTIEGKEEALRELALSTDNFKI